MARIALISMDTRGGVQPYVALARGLQRLGHEVRVVAPSGFGPLIEERGLRFCPVSGSVEEMTRVSKGVAEKGTLASMKLVREQTMVRLSQWAAEILLACEGCDVLIGGIGGMIIGLSVAEKLGARFLQAHLQPVMAPTREFPGVLVPRAPRFLNRLSHAASEFALWMPFRPAIAHARKTVLQLDSSVPSPKPGPVVYGFSPELIPKPADWSTSHHVTGYWTLPATSEWRPPESLTNFLAAGPPPVCIGFGSMAADDPQALSDLVLEAVKQAGVRAVLLSGWKGLAAVSREDVLMLEEAPHDWLLPKMAAVVHHGGAGTTGAGLASGVPSIVVPFMMDQPFWGSRIAQLGVGPAPIPRKALTAPRLAAALRTATSDASMKERARMIGERVRAEDGVSTAAQVIHEAVAASPT